MSLTIAGGSGTAAQQTPVALLPFHPFLSTGLSAIGASNILRSVRVVVPKNGTLTALSVFVGTASGNLRLAVYDTSATTRNLLASTASTAVAGSSAWQDVALQANLTVRAGDNLDLGLIVDNNTATFARVITVASNMGALPSGYWTSPLGGSPKIGWTNSPGSFTLPATISEASCDTNTNLFMCIAGKIT